ncbi:MAG: hypothetical protein AAF542_08545 [Pseudomonadota bacterium]
MIEILSAISRKYTWLRGLGIVLGVVSGGTLVLSLLSDGAADRYLIPSVVAFIWSLLLIVLSITFPNLPPRPTKEQKILARIKRRFRRLIFYSIGVVFIVLTVATVSLSFKMFGVWRTEYYS